MYKVTRIKDNDVVVSVYTNVKDIKESVVPSHIVLCLEDIQLLIEVTGYDIKIEDIREEVC